MTHETDGTSYIDARHSASDREQISELTALLVDVSKYVCEENLSPLKDKPWARSRDEVNHPIAERLHGLFLSAEGELRFIWLLLVMLMLPVSAVVESLLGASWILWGTLRPVVNLGGERITTPLIVVVPALFALYTVLGTYWILVEIVANHSLKIWVRILVLILGIASLVGLIAFTATHSLIPGVSFDSRQLNQALADLRGQLMYRIFVTIGLYFPVIGGVCLASMRGFTLFAISILSALRWLINYHRLESPEAICTFTRRPLFHWNGADRSLADLSEQEIIFLRSWATSRRDVIQSRLLPLSFMFTFVGLLANTEKANVLFDEIIDHFQVVWGLINGRIPWSWSILGSYAVFLGTVLLLFFVTKFLVEMFNESFVADYIVQACVLASPQTSTSSEQPCPESDSQTINVVVDRSFRNRGWLQRILRRRTWDD
jgi:hypothetical protein